MNIRKILQGKKIGIAGASIAGSTAALLLKRLGAEVFIFERSKRPFVGRGTGIVLPNAFIDQCVQLDLVDATIPRLPTQERSFLVNDPAASSQGKKIWQQPFVVSTLNWGDVYRNLRKRITPEDLHEGEAIIDVSQQENSCIVTTSAEKKYQLDFLLAADGIDSTIRKKIFPNTTPTFANYVAWRGVIDEAKIVDDQLFNQHVPYYAFQGGHILLYRIPAPDYEQTGKTLLNWVMYQDIKNKPLDHYLTDKNNKKNTVSIPAGSLSVKHIDELNSLAKAMLPDFCAHIIQQTPEPFLQIVFDLQVPNYVNERIGFIGDAATVLRPHTASGVIKAMSDSIRLFQTFNNDAGKELKELFHAWAAAQTVSAAEQAQLAKNMGAALVTHSPNWHAMTPDLMDKWWQTMMSGKSWYATAINFPFWQKNFTQQMKMSSGSFKQFKL